VESIPEDLINLLRGFPTVGVLEQAFPFLSTDPNGFPHSALLSRSELEPSADSRELMAVVASSRTKANLRRTGAAGLIAVDARVCHHVKFEVVGSLSEDDVLGCVLALTEYTCDDIGISLQPIIFRTSMSLVSDENWSRSRAMFDRLRRLRVK